MKHILVVDDVAEMLELMEQTLLALGGYRVDKAINGFEARRVVMRNRPDLVLLDEVLPGESSGDLLAELSGDEIPVLMLTGMEDPKHPVPPQARGRLLKPGWKSSQADRARIKKALEAALSAVSQKG